MAAILATIVSSFVWPERATQVPATEMIYISLAGVIMAFFGADALVSQRKG
jgi:preprotein translocase subunit SecE